MHTPNTFSTFNIGSTFTHETGVLPPTINFTMNFGNGYSISMLLPNPTFNARHQNFTTPRAIEIGIFAYEELLTLNDADTVAMVSPDVLGKIIAVLSQDMDTLEPSAIVGKIDFDRYYDEEVIQADPILAHHIFNFNRIRSFIKYPALTL